MTAYLLKHVPEYTMPYWATVHPEVLVQTWFKDPDGEPQNTGSGSFLSTWPAALLTAAHVVYLDAGTPPIKIKVTLRTHSGDDEEIFASAVGVHFPNRYDVAVVRLDWDRPDLMGGLPLGLAKPGNEYPVHLAYFTKSLGPIGEESTVKVKERMLRYEPNFISHPGMSGGAVQAGEKVIGIHSGEQEFNNFMFGVATPIVDADVIKMSRDAKAAVAKKKQS